MADPESQDPTYRGSSAQSVCGPDYRHALYVRPEGQQTAVAILHYKLARMPWHVGKSPSEFHASSCVLGIKCVCIFDKYVCVEQFVRIFVRIGGGRLGAAEVNRVLVARHDGIDRRILPRPQTFEAKLVFVIGERSGNVRGEELRSDLTDHGHKSSADTRRGRPHEYCRHFPFRRGKAFLLGKDLPNRASAILQCVRVVRRTITHLDFDFGKWLALGSIGKSRMCASCY
jgi:hypothetical protein